MTHYNILLLGSGGRESALAWKLSQSPILNRLFIAPGNGGTDAYGTNVALNPLHFDAIKEFCLKEDIQILLPGPEDPLVAGIADFFGQDPELKHIVVCGPSMAGAQLEGSKAFSKKFMARHGIPTATYREFDRNCFEEGLAYLKQHSLPVVIKADGLAAGKGVIIAQSVEEAQHAFRSMILDEEFGTAGARVVVEQFLDGTELSVFVLTDGANFSILPEAKDYKRIGEKDTGPNTGGMGAVSPVSFFKNAFQEAVIEKIIRPTVSGLRQDGTSYRGFIFFGLINVAGEPYVIEYNCRMGDPETEVVMPRLQTDLLQMILDMHNGKLDNNKAAVTPDAAATVMLVSKGYPGSYEKGKPMKVRPAHETFFFHAGTTKSGSGLETNGGRVLAVTALAPTLKAALNKAYGAIDGIEFNGKTYRSDIGNEFLDQA